jgi:hypothetical protein
MHKFLTGFSSAIGCVGRRTAGPVAEASGVAQNFAHRNMSPGAADDTMREREETILFPSRRHPETVSGYHSR